MAVDVELYKRAVARFPTGVAVIATALGERKAGMTVNALFSLSLVPPSIVVSMQRGAESTGLLRESRRAAISFLASNQQRVSELFSKRNSAVDKFAEGTYHMSPGGQPIINGSIAAMDVEVTEILPVADHDLMVCDVRSVLHLNDGPPLLYWGGLYASTTGTKSLVLPDPK